MASVIEERTNRARFRTWKVNSWKKQFTTFLKELKEQPYWKEELSVIWYNFIAE